MELIHDFDNDAVDFVFPGIAHCRYLKTVRTHLASLILPIHSSQRLPDGVENGMTEKVFDRLCAKGQVFRTIFVFFSATFFDFFLSLLLLYCNYFHIFAAIVCVSTMLILKTEYLCIVYMKDLAR